MDAGALVFLAVIFFGLVLLATRMGRDREGASRHKSRLDAEIYRTTTTDATGMLMCRRCGAEARESAGRCPRCGASL